MGKTISMKLNKREEIIVSKLNNNGISNSELIRTALWNYFNNIDKVDHVVDHDLPEEKQKEVDQKVDHNILHILQQQVSDLKQELKEEKIYYRDKLDNMEIRYDKRISEDIQMINDKFEKIMDSINDSRKYNYIPTHVRGLDINKPEYDTTMDKTIDEDKQEDLPERKGFWGRLFG